MLQLTIIGNLGADAQVGHTEKGAFVSFNVADTDRWTDAQGQVHEETKWIGVIVNGENEKLLPYLKRGTMVCVTGHRVKTRVYSSEKERRMVAGISVTADNVSLVGGRVDDVPSRLYTPDGLMVDVSKFYAVRPGSVSVPATLVDRGGRPFVVDPQGWVCPAQVTSPQQKQAAQEQAGQAAESNAGQANNKPATTENNIPSNSEVNNPEVEVY